MHACANGHVRSVLLLMEAGADVCAALRGSLLTPLMLAVINRHVKVVG